MKRAAPLLALGKRVKGPFVTDETVVAIGIFIGLPLYLSHAGPSVDLHHSEQSYPLGDTVWW